MKITNFNNWLAEYAELMSSPTRSERKYVVDCRGEIVSYASSEEDAKLQAEKLAAYNFHRFGRFFCCYVIRVSDHQIVYRLEDEQHALARAQEHGLETIIDLPDVEDVTVKKVSLEGSMFIKEQERIWKRFQRVIDHRDVSLIDRRLYEHLHLHCGDIAHYNLKGYRSYYSGDDGFKEFLSVFLNNWAFQLSLDTQEYGELNRKIRAYVKENLQQILFELENKETVREIALLKHLVEKYGYEVMAASDDALDVQTTVEKDGQCRFAI